MPQHHQPNPEHLFLTRRQLLQQATIGIGSMGLASIMSSEGLLAATGQVSGYATSPLAPKQPHFPAKAKHLIHLFMNGGPSQVDTFDPKPELTRLHGQELPKMLKTERKTGAAFKSPFAFNKYGQSGLEVSEMFPHVAESIDDIAVIRSMYTDLPNHEPSLMMMNSGSNRLIRPSVGSWLTYGLGTENENLPGFVAMCPGGYPIQESQNWQSGFLPGIYQGTYIDTKSTDIEELIRNIRNNYQSGRDQRKQLDLLLEMNERHAARREQDAAVEARMQSYELAYRMQSEATDAFDISKEPENIRQMYGEGTYARQLLIARRLIERGVRVVQIWQGAGQPWDNHDKIEENHRRLAKECDQPIGALLKDLKQRGLFDETLVLWGGEFGRTPTVELPQKGLNAGTTSGRDHNPYGFSVWLAGAGVKSGQAYGATDEFGFQAVDKRMHVHDLHATMLHLLGFDHEKFTYRHAGRDFRLTDVEGHVVNDLIA